MCLHCLLKHASQILGVCTVTFALLKLHISKHYFKIILLIITTNNCIIFTSKYNDLCFERKLIKLIKRCLYVGKIYNIIMCKFRSKICLVTSQKHSVRLKLRYFRFSLLKLHSIGFVNYRSCVRDQQYLGLIERKGPRTFIVINEKKVALTPLKHFFFF